MLCFTAGGALRAQQPAFSGVIRGVLIERDDPGPVGEFSLRARSTNQVYRFRFDGKTYVESEEQRVSMQSLQKGDTIEVVADRDESVRCTMRARSMSSKHRARRDRPRWQEGHAATARVPWICWRHAAI